MTGKAGIWGCRTYAGTTVRRRKQRFTRVVALCSLVLLMLSPWGGGWAAAQSDATAPVEVEIVATEPLEIPPTDVPVEILPTEEPPVPTDIPPTLEPTFVPPTTEPTLPPTPSPTQTPAPSPTPASSLAWSVTDPISCVPADSGAAIAHGAYGEYACTMDLVLTGELREATAARIESSVNATVNDGWSIQLRGDDGSWTEPATQTSISRDHSIQIPAGAGENRDRFTFSARVGRDRCTTAPASLSLQGGASVEVPGTEVTLSGSDTASVTIEPVLAPIPEPEVAFAGSLVLDAVSLSPSMETQTTTGTIALTVSGLDAACGTWNVLLTGASLGAENGSTIADSNMRLVAVNGSPPPDGSCSLDGSCLVGVVRGDAAGDAVETFTLEIALDVPAGTTPGSFNSTISASLEMP